MFGELGRNGSKQDTCKDFSISDEKMKDVGVILKETGYEIGSEAFFSYIQKATAAREYAKFIFTKNISDSLEIIAGWGEQIGLSRDELSYLTIQDIIDGAISAQGRTLEQFLRDKSIAGREEHQVTLALKLPYLIETTEDISVIPLLLNRPNFISNKTVRGPYVFISGRDENSSEISNNIVLIESADPGFDWIFSCSLKGLITKYGGANSHMAIRCAEFDIPAAIGCGEQLFDLVLRSSAVELNCSEGRLVPVEG